MPITYVVSGKKELDMRKEQEKKMKEFDQDFLLEMKGTLDVELLGVIPIDASVPKELKEPAISLCQE